MANVTGPGSSTDTAVARWNGTSGTAIQDSSVTIDGSDNMAGLNSISSDGGAFATDGSGNVTLVALTGNPTTTTQSPGDNSTKIATTAYVDSGLSGLSLGDLSDVVTTSDSMFLGTNSGAGSQHNHTTAIGIDTFQSVNGTHNVLAGYGATVTGPNSSDSVAIGADSVGGPQSTALGRTATAIWTNSMALGANASTSADNTIQLGDASITDVYFGAAGTNLGTDLNLLGDPTTTTQSPGDNSTKIATTAYVDAATAGLGASLGLNTQSGGYTLVAGDAGYLVDFTGSSNATFAFTAAATLGNNWFCYIRNNGTSQAELTLNPNGSELIDGVTSYIMYPGEIRVVRCTGSAFGSFVVHGFQQLWTASGTMTIPPGYKQFQLEIWSGGGSGGSRTTTGNVGGGGGGGYICLPVPSSKFVAAGSTETVTVGGTAAGVSGNNNGTAGNNSSVTINGTTYAVLGGKKGGNAATGALAGGGPSGIATFDGTFGLPGNGTNTQDSLYSLYTSTAPSFGSTTLYGAAAGLCPSTNVPTAGGSCLYGGGAGGGSSSTAGGVRTGGTSFFAGAGGAGGANTGGNGTNGSIPCGGGGGAVQGGTSGSGAAGQVMISGSV